MQRRWDSVRSERRCASVMGLVGLVLLVCRRRRRMDIRKQQGGRQGRGRAVDEMRRKRRNAYETQVRTTVAGTSG